MPGHHGNSILNGAPFVCGSSVWNLLYVTLLALRILRRLLEFWKVCALPVTMCV